MVIKWLRMVLLTWNGVACVLVTKIFDIGSQVPKEDYHPSDLRLSVEHIQPTNVALSNLLRNLNVCPIYLRLAPGKQNLRRDVPTVPKSKPPFKQNFMFEVPDASVPAVEMC